MIFHFHSYFSLLIDPAFPWQEPQLLFGVGTGAKGVAALGCSRQHRPQEGGEVAARKKRLDVAARQKRLGVAPHKSWGLVWFVPARRERETGIAPVLGRLVFLNRILDVELENRWCLHVNEQGRALSQCL